MPPEIQGLSIFISSRILPADMCTYRAVIVWKTKSASFWIYRYYTNDIYFTSFEYLFFILLDKLFHRNDHSVNVLLTPLLEKHSYIQFICIQESIIESLVCYWPWRERHLLHSTRYRHRFNSDRTPVYVALGSSWRHLHVPKLCNMKTSNAMDWSPM